MKILQHGLGLTVVMGLCACGASTPAKLTTLVDHRPQVLATAQELGRVDGNTALHMHVVLPLQHEDELDAFLSQVYDPTNPGYAQYLTPQEFGERFAPNSDDVESIRTALTAEGLQPAAQAHGFLLDVEGTAASAERFFHTHLNNYVLADGSHVFAPSTPVEVDARLAVASVTGLRTPTQYHTNFSANFATRGTPLPTAQDIRTVYQIPATATGKLQTVALLELDGYAAVDVTAYNQQNNLHNVPLTNILVSGFNGQPSLNGGDIEVTLDIEMMNALAPNAAQFAVFESDQDFMGIINEMATPSQGAKQLYSVISCSWGSAESQSTVADMTAENAVFKQMAAQGQTFVAASGDNGSRGDGKTVGVSDPASQPFALAVGGTTLTTSANFTTYASEKTWLDGGGGISTQWTIPAWQSGLITAATKGSTTMRNVPDVALNADPNTGYVFYAEGQQQIAGGTSFAAPLWAAFIALVNEQRQSTGLGPMGFAAPAIYAIGKSSVYSTTFHDIADGSTNGTYPAEPGYDCATGWGSFIGSALLPVMSAGYGRSTFTAPSWPTGTVP